MFYSLEQELIGVLFHEYKNEVEKLWLKEK